MWYAICIDLEKISMKKFLILLIAGSISIVACNKNSSNDTAGNASINVYLVELSIKKARRR